MYADDTHLTFSSSEVTAIEEALNRDLESVNNWLVWNKLTLNSTKTEFNMLIGSRVFKNTLSRARHLRGCLHDTGTSFILVRVVNFIPRLHGRHKY